MTRTNQPEMTETPMDMIAGEGARRTRRARDPKATREAILEAAQRLLARDGPEGVSLSAVAILAKVNRGTAYQHFETREKLVQAAIDWASEQLFRAVFGDPDADGEPPMDQNAVFEHTERLAFFAMENPDLCRIWMLHLLGSRDPGGDLFWRRYRQGFAAFAQSPYAQADMDHEVLSVLMLAGALLWPTWAHAHADDVEGRRAMARRFARENLRFSLYGTMRKEAYPAIADMLNAQKDKAPPR